ncbi:MAG: hypothetical protein AAGA28_14205 [Pseudomonadota bacterium]
MLGLLASCLAQHRTIRGVRPVLLIKVKRKPAIAPRRSCWNRLICKKIHFFILQKQYFNTFRSQINGPFTNGSKAAQILPDFAGYIFAIPQGQRAKERGGPEFSAVVM